MALDRIVPLPGFNYEEHPYVLVNRSDVMDLSTGDLICKLSGAPGQQALGAVEKTDLLMTYGNDDVLQLHQIEKRGFGKT